MLHGVTFIDDHTLTEMLMLVLAFALSAVVGAERQRRSKSAGLRTHVLVGLGSALFTLVSAYGFRAIAETDVVVDPTRIAAQIVSGIGFLGAGLIFIRRNTVNGLTTAASVWMTAAIGMACGAGMPLIAVFATALYTLAVTVLARLGRRMPRADGDGLCVIEYKDGRGVLRDVLEHAGELGFRVSLEDTTLVSRAGKSDRVRARLRFRGHVPVQELVDEIGTLRGVSRIELVQPS